MNSTDDHNFAIVCVSCDKFSSLWPIFFRRFAKFWQGPDFPKYVITNFKNSNDDNWQSIKVGLDLSWSSNLLKALDKIKEDNIFFVLEDAPLNNVISNNEIFDVIENFNKYKMDYLNLKSTPMPSLKYQIDSNLRKIPLDMPYRTSFAPAVWKKSVLCELLNVNESAWEFEIKGSVRSRSYKNFYVLSSPLMQMLHIIIKGKVDLRANRVLLETGERSEIDFMNMNALDSLKLTFFEFINLLIKPFSYKIRKFFHKIKHFK